MRGLPGFFCNWPTRESTNQIGVALNEAILLHVDVLRAEFTRAERILASHEIDVIDDLSQAFVWLSNPH